MQTSLQAIAYKAELYSKYRFQNLYQLLDQNLLTSSFYQLNRKSAKGVDGQSWQQYQSNLMTNLGNLTDKLKRKTYKTKLIKRVFIPKSNGKERPLGLPAVEDKIVQSATSKVLQSIYEKDFLETSFGYRPKMGAHDAIQCLTINLQYGKYGYVVEADIKGFFDNMDHDWLLRMLAERIDDKAMLALIRKWLKSGVLMPDGAVENPESGSPQGGLISPLLANLYLHYALDLWFYKVVKPRMGGQAMLIRYADDFVCAFQYKRDAERFYKVLRGRLGRFNLEVAEEKTQLMRFSRFKPGVQKRIAFLGFEIYWDIDRNKQPRLKKRTAKKKLQNTVKDLTIWLKENRNKRLNIFFKKLNQKLRGHYQYFGLIGNSTWVWQYFKEVVERSYKWLNRRSQRRSFNWLKFREVMRYHQLLKPTVRKLILPRAYII